MFRTVGDQESLWESLLPDEVRRLSEELARVDGLLNDPAFFVPFVSFFDPRMGRPSTRSIRIVRSSAEAAAPMVPVSP